MLNRVSELRKTNGLTQQELADKLEVSRQTIISLEKENMILQSGWLIRLQSCLSSV